MFVFSFDVGRSMFDVGRSMFDVGRSSLKTTPYGINKTCEHLQNDLTHGVNGKMIKSCRDLEVW
jgi:hypothetical protein